VAVKLEGHPSEGTHALERARDAGGPE
jgi:hypothetical protein